MALIQRPAQESDITSLCDVFLAAFASDLVMAQCFPDVPSVREFLAQGLKKGIANPKCHVECIVDTDLPDSPIIAYSDWKLCDEDTTYGGPSYPSGGDVEIAETFFPQLKKKKLEIMAGRSYWYLNVLVSHPNHQGRGAGRMLLNFGIQLADDDRKDIYVEASPAGLPVYRKFGWREVDRVVVLDGQFTEVLMIRDGKTAGS